MSRSLNPVLAREVKERVRGGRAFAALTVFLVFLTVTTWVTYQSRIAGIDPSDLSRRSTTGRVLFEWTLVVMVLLILFMVPGLTAGAVAGERERQTLLPLQVTLLRPSSILLGKAYASLAFLALMTVAALPLFAVAYRLGGVTFIDGVVAIVSVLIVGFLLAVMVLGISTVTKRVQTATLLAYGFTMLFAAGSFIAFGVATIIDDARGGDRADPPAIVLTPNPLVFLADATAGRSDVAAVGPVRGLRDFVDRSALDNGWLGRNDLAGGFDRFPENNRPTPRAWMLSLGWQVLFAGLLFWWSTRRLRTPAESER